MNNKSQKIAIAMEDKAWILIDTQTGKIIDISYEEICPGRFQVLSNTGLQRVKKFPEDFKPEIKIDDLEEAYTKEKEIWDLISKK